jgi:acyl-CoA synthetase (NDP forming)
MQPSLTNLGRLLAPKSVAVVGASNAPDKAGHQAMLALARFVGEVIPINPKAGEILGRRAFSSLTALARPVDLVVFAVPAPACVDAVREAIECGCGGGLIVGGGFAESGAAGAVIQRELESLLQGSSFRLLGPNTAGFINRSAGLTASFVAGADRIPAGNIAVVAQSAGICLTVSFLLAEQGYGVSLAVGLGNAVDVEAADVLEFLVEQLDTRAIALHLEGVPRGRRLYDVLRRVTPRKPVAVLAVGEHDVGEFARSHTGNLMGVHSLRVNALRQAGAVVVSSTTELGAAAALLALKRLPPNLSPGIGLMTAQAGPGLAILDRLKARGIAVPPLTPRTLERVTRLLPPMTYMQNPVDTGRPSESFAEVVTALSDDEGIDAVAVFALSEPAAFRPSESLPSVAARTEKPILFGTTGPREETAPTIEALRAAAIPTASSPEQLAEAVVVLATDAIQQAKLLRELATDPRKLEVEAPQRRDEDTAKHLLETLGIPAPRRSVCVTRDEARAAFRHLEKPVVAKILSSAVHHKTELGGVHLGIVSVAELELALAQLDAILLTSERRYLIEEMAPPGLELILGAVRDPSFGPVVTLGLGGTFAEALRDTATRLAPLSLEAALEMIAELRSASLFGGFRGRAPLDRLAVAEAVVSVGDLLCRDASVTELELNPLRVYPKGVLALDALLI